MEQGLEAGAAKDCGFWAWQPVLWDGSAQAWGEGAGPPVQAENGVGATVR